MHARGAQQGALGELRPLQLQADGQTVVGETARDTDAADASQVATDGVNVTQVHRQRVGRLFARLEGGGGSGGARQHIALAEHLLKVLQDQPANLERLQVVGVDVAAGQGIGAQHDAALHLGAESLAAAAAVLLDEVALLRRAVTVAHPVETGQVAGGFRRGDQVVGGHGVRAGGQRHIDDGCPLAFVNIQCGADGFFHLGIEAFAEELARNAHTQAGQRLVEVGQVIGYRLVDAGAVAAVMAGDRLQQHRAAGHIV